MKIVKHPSHLKEKRNFPCSRIYLKFINKMFSQDKYYHQILSSMPVALTKSDGFKNMDFSPKTISLLPEKLEKNLLRDIF